MQLTITSFIPFRRWSGNVLIWLAYLLTRLSSVDVLPWRCNLSLTLEICRALLHLCQARTGFRETARRGFQGHDSEWHTRSDAGVSRSWQDGGKFGIRV